MWFLALFIKSVFNISNVSPCNRDNNLLFASENWYFKQKSVRVAWCWAKSHALDRVDVELLSAGWKGIGRVLSGLLLPIRLGTVLSGVLRPRYGRYGIARRMKVDLEGFVLRLSSLKLWTLYWVDSCAPSGWVRFWAVSCAPGCPV